MDSTVEEKHTEEPTKQEEKSTDKPLSSKIIKIKKEKMKDGERQFSVIYEGSDSKKGVWVDASIITDESLIADFEKRQAKKKKRKKEKEEKKKEKEEKHKKKKEEKEKKSKDRKEKEEKQKKEKTDGGSKSKKEPIDKIHGLIQATPEFVFSVKLKDTGYVEMTLKEMRSKYPRELIDFFTKNISIIEQQDN